MAELLPFLTDSVTQDLPVNKKCVTLTTEINLGSAHLTGQADMADEDIGENFVNRLHLRARNR